MLRDRLREVLERDRAVVEATRSFTHGFTPEESGTRMRLPKAKARALDADEIASIDALLSGDFVPVSPASDRAPAAEPRGPAPAKEPDAGVRPADAPRSGPTPREQTDQGTSTTLPAPAQPGNSAQPSAAWQAARSWRDARQGRSGDLPVRVQATTSARSPAAFPGRLPPFELSPESPLPEVVQATAESPVAEIASEPAAMSLFADWIAAEVSELTELSRAPIVLTPELAPTLHTGTLAPGAPEEGEEARSGKEPIRTRTMARLLAGHGYKLRALSIYDELLARRPADADLRAEAEALRRSPK